MRVVARTFLCYTKATTHQLLPDRKAAPSGDNGFGESEGALSASEALPTKLSLPVEAAVLVRSVVLFDGSSPVLAENWPVASSFASVRDAKMPALNDDGYTLPSVFDGSGISSELMLRYPRDLTADIVRDHAADDAAEHVE